MRTCNECGREMSTTPDPESSVELAIGDVCLYCELTNDKAPTSARTEVEAGTQLNTSGIKRDHDFTTKAEH